MSMRDGGQETLSSCRLGQPWKFPEHVSFVLHAKWKVWCWIAGVLVPAWWAVCRLFLHLIWRPLFLSVFSTQVLCQVGMRDKQILHWYCWSLCISPGFCTRLQEAAGSVALPVWKKLVHLLAACSPVLIHCVLFTVATRSWIWRKCGKGRATCGELCHLSVSLSDCTELLPKSRISVRDTEEMSRGLVILLHWEFACRKIS